MAHPWHGVYQDVCVRHTCRQEAYLDVGGVRGGHRLLGHGEAGADVALQQGQQPTQLLGPAGVLGKHLHVASVGCAAVEYLRGPCTPGSALIEEGGVNKRHEA